MEESPRAIGARGVSLALVLLLAPHGAVSGTPLAPGSLVERVTCAHAPSQSYALYLPSAYRDSTRWPILYAFDPMARGRVAVEVFQKAAERLGVVVAASNNSRNGPIEKVIEAMDAVFRDTSTRLSLDPSRVYAAGMSGGTQAALILGKAKGKGVIACAGPLEASRLPALDPLLAWVGIAGDADFTLEPTREVVETLLARGLTARLATFAGRHDWPPEEVAGDALGLLELVAMRDGRRPRDDAFVEAYHEAGLSRARNLVARGRHDVAAKEYAALARELDGLLAAEPIEALKAEARRLGETPEAKKGRKRDKARASAERSETARVQTLRIRLERALQPSPPSVGGPGLAGTLGPEDESLAFRAELESALARLARRAASDDEEDRIVAWRVLDGFFIDTFAGAMERRAAGQLGAAEAFLGMCGRIRPESASAAYEHARSLAALGDAKKALAELRRAAGLGFRNAARLREEPEWAPLRGLPGFQELLAEVDAREQSPR